MADLLRLATVFLVILLLLRRKWNVGYVLMAASAALAMLYLMRPGMLLQVVRNTVTGPVTLKLLVALTFIRVFEFILREKAVLDKMMGAMKGIFRNKKAVIISMPLLIGMLPSVGGAYFSAPMVAEATRDLSMAPEEKAFANYWFRHPWEFTLPLYPGIVLASVLTSIELRTFILLNLASFATMFVTGLYGMRGVRGRYEKEGPVSAGEFRSFLPILGLLGLVIAGRVELHTALVVMVLVLILFFRLPLKGLTVAFRHGFSRDVIVLIAGVMLFKEALEVSGAVENISRFFSEKEIPIMPVLLLLPFITGVLTGITVGFVGSTFPLILSLTGPDPHAFALAFASGFAGVLLSPVHVCLILTKEYFRADMWEVYRKTIPSTTAVLLVAVLEYLVI